MFKNILRLLAASTSFVALLLITNAAVTTTWITDFDSQLRSPTVSLNVVSPAWQLASNQDLALNHYHFGCSCDACIQSLEQDTRQV